MKGGKTVPPVKKNRIFLAVFETGQGVDKTENASRVRGVVYMASKKTEQIPEVQKITRSKDYRTIKEDLLKQLKWNDNQEKYYEDLINDYMAMYVTKTLLSADIQKRGVIVEYNNGGGQKGYKRNEAVDMFNKTNAQMLKLLNELGLKANTSTGGDCNDEL